MNMKRVLTIMVAGSLVLTCAACSKDEDKDVLVNQEGGNTPVINEEIPKVDTPVLGNEGSDLIPGENTSNEQKTPTETQTPVVSQKPVEDLPAKKPVEKPSEPEQPSIPDVPVEPVAPEQPSESEQPKQEETTASVGNVLLKDFNAKASSASSVLELAESLVSNSVIPFMGGAMEVEEGFLQGFDNVEIKGFKSGAVFMPMIGSIPFIGYVFELENAADVPAFISTLESNANLRWNICVTADEMVSGSVGNKVFFVMAPTSFGE